MNEKTDPPAISNNEPRSFEFFPDMSTHVQTEAPKNPQNQSTHVETRPDNVRFTLTVEEASELLAQAGVPRSPKTVTRFCKDGQLEFTRARTEKNYKFLIEQKSLERLIKELQQTKGVDAGIEIQSTHVETESKNEQNTSAHVQTREEFNPDMSRQDVKASERETTARVEVVYLDERERGLLERMLADREAQIKSLATDKEDLREQIKSERDMRKREQEMHMEQVKLLAASEKGTRGVTKAFANLINNIWPGAKGSTDGDQPIALTPMIRDIEDELGGDGEE